MTLPSYVGRYEVRKEIGRGGFAVVVQAWDEELQSLVALKILHRELAHDERGPGSGFWKKRVCFGESARPTW